MSAQLITKELLEEFGIATPETEVPAVLEHLNTTLDERVGAEVTESLTDEQLEALLTVQENGSDEEVGAWLAENVPELEAITEDEIAILLGEIAENADNLK